ADNGRGRLEAPVRQQYDVVAVVVEWLWLGGIKDEWKVQAEQLLPARMAVGPVGAALAHREAVGERLARLDATKADPRHAVHVGRHKHPVPVDRADLLQAVRNAQDSVVALAQPEEWPRHRAVEGHGLA